MEGRNFLEKLEGILGVDLSYVIRGSFWWVLGRVFSFLSLFILFSVFAHFVSKETFGSYQYVISTAGILSLFALPGLDTAFVRAVARGFEKSFLSIFKEKLKFGMLGSLISLFISLWYFFQKNINLGISFLIVSIFLPFLCAFNLYLAFWQGKKRFDLQNQYFVFQNFLAVFLLILVIFFARENLIFILLAYYFSFTLTEAIFWLKTLKNIEKNFDFQLSKEIKETVSFGKHLTLIFSLTFFSRQIDKIFIWHFLGPQTLANYAFASRVVQRLGQIIPFSALALPKMAQRDLKKIKKNIFDKFLKLFLPSTLFFLAYFFSCPYIFKLFFPKYSESIFYSQILAILLLFSPFSFLATSFLAEAKKRELYILSFVPEILKIVLFFFSIPLFGIWGAIFSILISQIFYSALTLYLFKKL